jgi:alkane 1-monooxygenase
MNHGRLVLLFSNYNHFWIEHLWGHHKRVATEEDPASSALNESFWTFIWKCLYLSFVSACRIEAKFQERHGRGFWNVHNRIVVPYLVSFAIDLAIYKYFGPAALCCHLVQSFLTAFLTDNANYIEHYGLRRKRLSDKKDEWGWNSDYERPGWMHAWNTGDRISNPTITLMLADPTRSSVFSRKVPPTPPVMLACSCSPGARPCGLPS